MSGGGGAPVISRDIQMVSENMMTISFKVKCDENPLVVVINGMFLSCMHVKNKIKTPG